MINILITKFNFEVVNLCITRTYCTQLYINSVISFVRVFNSYAIVNEYCTFNDQTPVTVYLFGNQQASNTLKLKTNFG